MIHLIINNLNKMKIKLTKGLTLNKEAITKLQEAQMSKVKGGINPPVQSCRHISCLFD